MWRWINICLMKYIFLIRKQINMKPPEIYIYVSILLICTKFSVAISVKLTSYSGRQILPAIRGFEYGKNFLWKYFLS